MPERLTVINGKRRPVPAAIMQDDANETDRALERYVGLVVVLALCALIGSWFFFDPAGATVGEIALRMAALTPLIAVGDLTLVQVRIRSNLHGISWSEAAGLLSLALLPLPLALLTVAGGALIAKLVQRVKAQKLVFGVAKETLVAASAGLVLLLWNADFHGPPTTYLVPLAVAFVVAVAMDEILFLRVISLATRTSAWDRFRTNLDLRLAAAAVRLAVLALTLIVLEREPQLLLAVAPLVFSLHLTHKGRMRARQERLAWQHLAEATDALNAVQLETVLRNAVHNGARLFSADRIEIEVWKDGIGQLIHGTDAETTYFGDVQHRPLDPTTTAVVPLIGDSDGARIGELRLCFQTAVPLNEREHLTLRAFASALCTAIRNAGSYAQLEQLAGQHEHDANHDPLTRLPNRRHLHDAANAALERRDGRRGVAALLVLDLNHFKDVNDALGHSAGDQVLVAVAERLAAAAGADALVTRLGGDEFAVLYPALPAPALATHRASALLLALQEPVVVDGMPLTISASAGIATAPSQGGFVELLRRADIAMYQAKRTGRPVAAYARDTDTADRTRLAVGGMLPRAVAEKEFTLEFQPIVDLATGVPTSAEALARWHHPDRGTVNPGSFLEPIERSGLLTAFTDAVLDQALAGAAQWRAAGRLWPVAVNISPRSLLDRRLPALIAARLDDHGLSSEALVLELTESLTISQLEIVDKVVAELAELGCMLALDDFGTGYSSLSVLNRVPAQEIKIDRSFVIQMETSANAAAVVRSTIELARGLDLLVVAEGIERESQRRMLWELGCLAGQGHLFAKPMPLAELLRHAAEPADTPLAQALHEPGSVVRMPPPRRTTRPPEIGRVSDSSA